MEQLLKSLIARSLASTQRVNPDNRIRSRGKTPFADAPNFSLLAPVNSYAQKSHRFFVVVGWSQICTLNVECFDMTWLVGVPFVGGVSEVSPDVGGCVTGGVIETVCAACGVHHHPISPSSFVVSAAEIVLSAKLLTKGPRFSL
jgi:hypothetical protein